MNANAANVHANARGAANDFEPSMNSKRLAAIADTMSIQMGTAKNIVIVPFSPVAWATISGNVSPSKTSTGTPGT
jgi:hypothetical protein